MDPLIDLALLLFGAKVGGILFSKIKQPSIAGELIAGLILGPSFLAVVNPSGLVTSVGHLGLLFLILLVSLSIDWKVLEGSAEKYVWIEIVRIIVTVFIIFLVSLAFGWDIYIFLIICFVTILSSTAIVSRTLADMKVIGTPQGQMLMGLEVVDEVVAIVGVALLANILSGASVTFEPVLTTILVVVGFFVVMSRLGFKFVNRMTSSIQKYGIEEALLGFTLLLAFILGSVTESLNLGSILGVFIAGMVFSRSAQSQIIVRKVKDIGESFFIPIFFASVGLTLNLFIAASQAYIIILMIAGIFAIKMLSSVLTMKIFRYTTEDAVKVGSGFVTLSEMMIVIIALASPKIDPFIYIGIITSFLVINILSPLFINFVFRHGSRLKPIDYKLRMMSVKVIPNKKKRTYTYKAKK